MLHVLFRQDAKLSGQGLKFHIEGKVAEFGRSEFALVSGLKFDEKTCLPEQSLLHVQVFDGRRSVTMNDIKYAFLEWAEKENGEGETTLQLALLWVLHGVLLAKGAGKGIDMEYLHIVNDLDAFNRYPWVTIAFDLLCESTRTAMGNWPEVYENKKIPKDGGVREKFNNYGLTRVLQVWAYKAIPQLRPLCCEELTGADMLFLRLLRWKVDKQFHFADIQSKVFDNPNKDLYPRPKKWSSRTIADLLGCWVCPKKTDRG